MPHVDETSFAELFRKALNVFMEIHQPANEFLLEVGYGSISETARFYLFGQSWQDLAVIDSFPPVDAARMGITLDLGEIPISLSRDGLRYFTPGLLLHFLRHGTYEHHRMGPSFFTKFVVRLQHDDERVLKDGGLEPYFSYSPAQRALCAEIMKEIIAIYGDDYWKFEDMGFEYKSMARMSLTRALTVYWHS